jgi:predicted NUDIX family NTP pyrophosphohydrolase
LREFQEETGTLLRGEQALKLQPVKQKGGKIIYAWAVEGHIDPSTLVSNEFEMEWPPKSGKMKTFPEVDEGRWFSVEEAKVKINVAQVKLIDQVLEILRDRV